MPYDLPQSLLSGPFRVADALALGVPHSALCTSRFRHPFHGVCVPATLPDTLELRCRAACLVVPDDAAFSHTTAAALTGLSLPNNHYLAMVHVMVPPGIVVPRGKGIAGHTGLEIDDVTTVGKLRIVHPERTFFHLATTFTVDDLIILGDSIVRRWSKREKLIGRVAGMSRRRGIERARTALTYVRERVDSAMETRVRLILVHAGLPEPVVNMDVFDEYGDWIARPDLSYPDLKIAIEYDGDHHRTDKHQWRRDRTRDESLRAQGWIVVTLTADDVFKHPNLLVSCIKAHVMSQTAIRDRAA